MRYLKTSNPKIRQSGVFCVEASPDEFASSGEWKACKLTQKADIVCFRGHEKHQGQFINIPCLSGQPDAASKIER
jgi:hypothetical protein